MSFIKHISIDTWELAILLGGAYEMEKLPFLMGMIYQQLFLIIASNHSQNVATY